ncbi:MAG: transposase [bacterium]|nr:transposase [bacterium]
MQRRFPVKHPTSDLFLNVPTCDVGTFFVYSLIMDIYHVLSRGVDKRKIFLNNRDYFRFIHNLFEFNNSDLVSTSLRRGFNQCLDIARRDIGLERRVKRKLLVDIHAFCLMPNHYHLLLSPRIKDGIPRFMKKLNMGYAKYFNIKNERKGTLFESRYKSILIENENHFMYLPHYIHLNPLDLYMPEWREGKLRSFTGAMKFLENYRWSSFPDYIGQNNFPSVTSRSFLLDVFGGNDKYKSRIQEFLNELDLENIVPSDLLLE